MLRLLTPALLTALVAAAAVASPPATTYLADDFNYSDGALVGRGGWQGSASSEIYLTGATVRITGALGSKDAYRTVSYSGSGNVIWVHFQAMPGTTGTGATMWSLWLDDTAGNSLARFYGTASTCRGRVGGTSVVTDSYDLATGAWNDLDVRIDTAANTCEFLRNRTYMGKLDHTTTPNNTLGKIRWERISYDPANGHTFFFDELRVGAQPGGSLCDPPGAPTANVIAIGDPAQNSAVAAILAEWPQAVGKAPKSEGYILGIKDGSVLIRGFDQRGTFYGCQTLILLLEQYSAAPIDGLFCYDYPDLAWRGTFVRVWADRDWDFAKEVLSEVMARYKMNVLEPDITMTYDSHPEIPLTYGEPVPKPAAADYVSFARQCFMEIIGCGAGFEGSDGSFTNGTLNANLREDQSAPDQSGPENLCPQNPAAIQLVNECRQERIDLLHPAYMQIGQSEYAAMRAPSCPRCGGLSNIDWFVMCLTNDANYYASKGIRPVMWGDMLRQDMPAGATWGTWQCVPNVPKSIIVQDWDYSTKTDFPSLATWNANGLTSLGAPFGLGIYGYVGHQNIYYWGKSCSDYGNMGLVAFNKYRTLYKQETFNDVHMMANMACFPFYAEWSWTAERPYWNPDPYSGQQMVLDRISPDRPYSFTASKAGDNVQLNWTNPPESKFQATWICYRTDTYPKEPIEGVFVADVAGSPNGAGSFTHTSVPLGATVYYSAFSHDGVRHFSATSTASASNGTPLSVADLYQIPDGKTINVAQGVVTAAYDGFFYIENAARTAGIRVQSAEEAAEGDIVTVVGALGRSGAERSLAALWVNVTGHRGQPLGPLACRNSSVGGADRGFAPGSGGFGLNNVGLLLRVVGTKESADPGGAFFYVNDGSNAGGIKVVLTGAKSAISIPSGSFLAVTGAASLDPDGRAIIRPRSQADIVTFAP